MENSAVASNTTLQPIDSEPVERDIRAIFASLPFNAGYFLAMDVMTPINLLLVVLGITANIHNICVFFKTGSRDNVTVSFIALSISDLLYLVLMSPHITVSSLNHLIQYRLGVPLNWLVDPGILLYILYWYALVFYETSILITVYISVVRCACVAIPFRVKSTFTAGRAAIAFIIFFISVLLLRLPSLMKRRIAPATNTSRAKFVELEDGGLADKLNDIINRNILTWFSFLTVIACLVVMVTKLQASAKFRSKTSRTTTTTQKISHSDKNKTAGSKTGCSETAKSPPCNDDKALGETEASRETNQNFLDKESAQETLPSVKIPITSEKPSQPQAISTREAQIIRSVLLVAAVFVTCQLPLMVYSLVRRLDSRFDDTTVGNISTYIFIFSFSSNLSKVFSLINASINIFIYYNFNSRYRHCAKSLWKCNRH